MKFITATSSPTTWIYNPSWPLPGEDAGAPVHGTLTRKALDFSGPLSIEEWFTLAEPHLRQAVEPWLGAPGAPEKVAILGARQVHGDRIVRVRRARDLDRVPTPFRPPSSAPFRVHESPDADAMVSTAPGVLLVIKTADCLPILFWDPSTRTVGACHCGWRGLLSGLAGKVVREMISMGANPGRIQAWLGPGIRARHYEVSSDLADEFRRAYPAAGLREGRQLDLFRVAAHQLEAAGVPSDAITDSGECTYAHADLYHSHRRDADRAGRLITLIGLPPVG